MNLNRLIGVAKKALDSRDSSSNRLPGSTSGGQNDWRSMVRSAANAITGDERAAQPPSRPDTRTRGGLDTSVSPEDRAAIARYDYLLETAEPSQIEIVHREAFERLTPEQRAQVEDRMRTELPPHEHPRSAEPADLARTAARAEAGKPGILKRLLAGGGGGRGAMLGGAAVGAGVGVAAGGLLAAVAGGAILSSVAGPLLAQAADIGVDFDALGGSFDLEGLAGGASESFGGFDGQASGFGEQVGEAGSGFDLPGLDDFFGR